MQIVVKCCLNHLGKKYGVLNNNGIVRKKAYLTRTQENMYKVVNAVSKIMFKCMFIKVDQA